MEALILLSRIASAQAYLDALKASYSADWLEWLSEYHTGRLTLAHAFALVHPEHYSGLDPSGSIRGPRQFAVEAGVSSVRCAVDVFWGYSCTSSKLGAVVGDHLFPYSLGGPTVSTNKIHLCTLHNQMKSNDVHVFPWEASPPSWLPLCLDAIRRLKIQEKRTRS